MVFSAIHLGISRNKIIALTVSAFVFTVAAGVIITAVGSNFLLVEAESEPGAIWAYLEIAVAILLGYWLLSKLLGKRDFEKKEKKQLPVEGSIAVYALSGAALSIPSVFDPTFIATAVVVADNNDVMLSTAVFTLWTLISQFMLFVLVVAYLNGREKPLVDATLLFWKRHGRLLTNLLYVIGALLVLLLLMDAGYYIVKGHYFSL
ncbi:hypothetical protein [Leucothrix arctica]|uniref:Uncharacterized protein n=1 Tax=Leucothrix arctica TaxID=1481894 RepID=A0A317CAU3_9GAMM|nr:hypothetical protein [Leucothrix arctica]PWQ95744.1 hypothetical protein DKT75_11970 [Leucothrix arctica]